MDDLKVKNENLSPNKLIPQEHDNLTTEITEIEILKSREENNTPDVHSSELPGSSSIVSNVASYLVDQLSQQYFTNNDINNDNNTSIENNKMEGNSTYENCAAAFFTSNKYTSPPYHILGVKYENECDIQSVVKSRTWFTYRSGFPSIPKSNGITSDAGWGCAVRVGQMLLCETFKRLEGRTSPTKVDLLKKFHDLPTCDYSLHQLVLAFAKDDLSKIGTWLGPNNVCHAIKTLVENSTSNLQVHVCMDSTVVVPEIPEPTADSPLLLFIPLRLGLDNINTQMYGKDLLDTFSYPQSVGIIGGRPRTAYWFFGCSEDSGEILALDPHTVKEFTGAGVDGSSHVCDSPLFIPSVDRLDPSLALGFVVKNQFELDDLVARLGDSRLCAILRTLPKADFSTDFDFDCDMPDTDDEFEILC